LKTLFDIIHY